MTEPVRPLEALIAEMKLDAAVLQQWSDEAPDHGVINGQQQQLLAAACTMRGRADELAALLQAAAQPAPTAAKSPDDVMDVYVPGNWTCPKCGFVLSSQTLFMGSGEIGCTRDQVMAMSGELCPNDGEPMHRMTWHERAEDNRKWGESLMEDIIAATHAENLPGALETARQNHRDIHAYRGALGYAVPGWHDGKLSDGTEPRCGMCDARSKVAPPAPTAEPRKEINMNLSLHRCKVCGTAWLLWPDAIHGGGWNLLDKYQRPGACCDNVAMGEQIEHLRDIPLTAAPPAPTAEPAAWRPIQTAPKDRRIVVWLETQRKGIVNWREKAQRWHEDGMGFCDPIYWFDVPTPDFDDAGETHGTVLS